MGSGYYPLRRNGEYGQALLNIASDLRTLRGRCGDQFSRTGLPAAWENDQTDNAASDGGYEAILDLALELIERCVEPEPVVPVAWTVPGDDTADANGFIPAKVSRDGEFTKPLYAKPR